MGHIDGYRYLTSHSESNSVKLVVGKDEKDIEIWKLKSVNKGEYKIVDKWGRYLDGRTVGGDLGMADNPNLSGTNWKLL